MTMKERRTIICYLLPLAITFSFVIIFPIFLNIYYSFHEKYAFSPIIKFIGLSNYFKLFSNPIFWNDVLNTLIYTFGSLLLQLIIGFCVALLLNEEFKGRSIARTLVILPYFISPVVAVGIFKWMLNELFGVIPQLLRAANVVHGSIGLLSNYAMLSLIIVSVWMYAPFVTICVLAGLQTIPPSLYEAADLDGASAINKLWYITLPGLKRIIIIVVLLRAIWMATKFDIPWLFLQGGPAGATETLPVLAYVISFREFNFGVGSTVATILFLALIAFGIFYMRYIESEEV
jgi:multiple sugar transport system permease protein